MKNLKKVIFIYVFGILVCTSFLIPRTTAQEWIYDGVDTTNIPGSSVYPTECYVYEPIVEGPPPGWGYLFEIVKGNMTIMPLIGNATTVWGDLWGVNLTSGEKITGYSDVAFGSWNETFGFMSLSYIPFIIPVESNGFVSLPILNNLSVFFELSLAFYEFENHQVYPNIHSIAFWNTSNIAYYELNYTDDGILTRLEVNTLSLPVGMVNITLYSQPAQLPPSFSFTTESGELTTNTTEIKLIANITDADNNNDGLIDTDNLYRIYNGTGWTSWAPVTGLIDYDLGSVAGGNYDITMEVKNMYGVTQKQITIQYIAPGVDGGIPSYPIAVISLIAIFSISFIFLKLRKKLRFKEL
ncbi:MAG: hypothetical protein KGD65_11410 [Candidatus Lokiarchaeota archaeon]|nr:hypothetical protein [Candidatus Lokiarchaeota archaeon]